MGNEQWAMGNERADAKRPIAHCPLPIAWFEVDPKSAIDMMSSVSAVPYPESRGGVRMSWLLGIWRSALGKKAVMAVTGLILFGWIFLHMIGNLKLYLGPVHMNEYAHWLRAIGTMPSGVMSKVTRAT